MKILSTILLSALLTGCVITPYGAYAVVPPAYECVVDVNGVCVDVAYEPDVIVGGYYVGYYNPGFGYWTGVGWDINFYGYGHPGYGHYYRGAPHGAYHAYRHGGHYRAGGHSGGHHHG